MINYANTPYEATSCPRCVLIPGDTSWCPHCHKIVKIVSRAPEDRTPGGVYEPHPQESAWDNVQLRWRRYKDQTTPCRGSGSSFQWLDYHECDDWLNRDPGDEA